MNSLRLTLAVHCGTLCALKCHKLEFAAHGLVDVAGFSDNIRSVYAWIVKSLLKSTVTRSIALVLFLFAIATNALAGISASDVFGGCETHDSVSQPAESDPGNPLSSDSSPTCCAAGMCSTCAATPASAMSFSHPVAEGIAPQFADEGMHSRSGPPPFRPPR